MSTLDELRARREALSKRDRHFDYGVPGYEPEPGKPSDLVIRFNPMSYGTLLRYQAALGQYGFMEAKKIDDDIAAEIVRLDADALAKSCREFLIRGEGGELSPLIEGQTTTFAQADEALGFEADTAVESVFGVFGLSQRDAELEVGAAAGVLREWTERREASIDGQIAGESPAGPESSASQHTEEPSA